MIILLIVVVLFVTAVYAFGNSPSSSPPSSGGSIAVDTIETATAKWASTFGVDPALVKAIIRKESSFNPQAVNPSDPSYGLMGITPILAQTYGYVKDWRNTTAEEIAGIKQIDVNIYLGTRFISELLGRHLLTEAIQMYNVGESGYEDKGYRAKAYLDDVLRFYDEYKN